MLKMAIGFNLVVVLAVQYIYIANGSKSKQSADRPIVYPGPVKQLPHNRYGEDVEYKTDKDVPEECKNENFCLVKPFDYPEKQFNDLFQGIRYFDQPSLVVEDIGDKQGDPEDRDDCASEVKFEPIYKVKSPKGDWRTVIQAPEANFIQQVRIEKCKKPGSRCFKILPSVPNYVTSCKQKYNTWEFLVQGPDGPEKLSTDLPVCCSCTYRIVKLSKDRW